MVGDSPYDAEAAGKLSLAAIGLLCGGFAGKDLRVAGCRLIYRDPEDLLAHYEATKQELRGTHTFFGGSSS